MITTGESNVPQSIHPPGASQPPWKRASGFFRQNRALGFGLLLLLSLLLFSVVGAMVYDTSLASPLSGPAGRPPSIDHPLGTDQQGRDMLAALIVGTPLTLRIGFIAGIIGIAIGTMLAFISGYYRGPTDTVIRTIVDVGLTIPGFLILIIIAISIKGNMGVNQVALVVAATAWLWPARSMRSQVLSMRQRTYVQVAQLSGMSGLEIIFREMMPILMPFIAASLVGAISAAVLASIGLEALGLGAMDQPTLGMTIYWAIYNSALMHGSWWVWAPAIVVILILFLGLFLLSIGLDVVANPRLRRNQ